MLEKNNFLLYLACLSILVFSYSPNLQFNFLYSDDYSYLFPKIGESKDFKIQANLNSFFEYFYKIGRPLTGYLIFSSSSSLIFFKNLNLLIVNLT